MVQLARLTQSNRFWLEPKIIPRSSRMLLVIDAGNTNVSLAVYRDVNLVIQWRLSTDQNKTSDEYGIQVRDLFEFAGIDAKAVNAVAIASVVPALNASLRRIVEVY